MFEYNKRKNFLDLLKPPLGFKLDKAIGTTYSLDFMALTAALLALLDTEADDESGIIDPSDVFKIMAKLPNKIAVFVNKTCIDFLAAKIKNRLFELFDQIVHDKSLPNRNFHPKVWLLKYVSRSGNSSIYRVICGSRNLRIGNNWELGVVLEGKMSARRDISSLGASMSEFCDMLFEKESKDEFKSFIQELKYVDFKICRETSGACEFFWQGSDANKLWTHIPKKGTHILIMSPFLKGDFIESLLGFDRLTLISVQEQLDAVFHDNKQLADRLLKSDKHKIYVVDPYEDDEEESFSLHAKLFICENGNSTTTFLGSANASYSGWQRNCEAVIAFSPGVNIERFCSDFIFKNNTSDFNGWISEYKESKELPGDDQIEKASLDRIQRDFSGVIINATYNSKDKRLFLVSKSAKLQEIVRDYGAQYTIEFLPLAFYNNSSQVFKNINILLEKGGVDFHAELDEVSEFIILQITNNTSRLWRSFIIKAISNFSSLLEEREAAYFKKIMNKDKFRDVLAFIIFDGVTYSYHKQLSKRLTGESRKYNDKSKLFFEDITLEDVMKSCTDDPSRIEEIDHLMHNTKNADCVEQDFEKFWTEFKAAFKKVSGKK